MKRREPISSITRHCSTVTPASTAKVSRRRSNTSTSIASCSIAWWMRRVFDIEALARLAATFTMQIIN